MIAWIFAIVVLAIVGKLIYDVQQNKKKPTQIEAEFDKDKFQKLAGIRPVDKNNELHETIVKNNFPKEQIVEALLKAAENSEFPKPDESINVQTTKIGAIDMKSYGDSDPLATIPMSRVSNEGKKKMAEIAKEDINKQVEQNAEKLSALVETKNVTEVPVVKPKRKYTKRKTSTK
jgi:hypothetical protein